MSALHRVVIVGGGFGGLYAAKSLGKAPVAVTLIDRRNFHLFQPLLYQVATGGLSPGEIASPLRVVLRAHRNTEVLLGEVVDLDVERRRVILRDGEAAYDDLIVATGATHHYFGNDQWAPLAPGLKTIEDATEIRSRAAGRLRARRARTGPREAPRVADLRDCRRRPDRRGTGRRLGRNRQRHPAPRFPPHQSRRSANPADRGRGPRAAAVSAGPFGQGREATDRAWACARSPAPGSPASTPTASPCGAGGQEQRIATRTVLWAAGVRASRLGKVLAERAGAPLDRAGRVVVEPDLSLPAIPRSTSSATWPTSATRAGNRCPASRPWPCSRAATWPISSSASCAASRSRRFTISTRATWPPWAATRRWREFGKRPHRRLPGMVRVGVRAPDVPGGIRKPPAGVCRVGVQLPHAQPWRAPHHRRAPGMPVAFTSGGQAVGAEMHCPSAGVENERDPQSATAWWCCNDICGHLLAR